MKCNVCGQEFGNGAYCQHCNADRITALGNYSGGYNAPEAPKNITSDTNTGGSNTTSGYGSSNANTQNSNNSSERCGVMNNREQFMVCYHCANVIPVDSVYCPCCGIKLFETCPKCGHKYSSQYKICNRCGTNSEEYLAAQRIVEQRKQEEIIRQETRKPEWLDLWTKLTGSCNGTTVLYDKKDSVPSRLVIPYGVKEIGENAFCNCHNLTEVFLSDSVTKISHGAFYDCTRLTSIYISGSVTQIEGGLGAPNLSKISVQENNQMLCSENDCCLSKDKKTLIFGCMTSIIPDCVTTIGDRAFCGRGGLTGINIPKSVVRIGDYAFWGCDNLSSIHLPSSVTDIGFAAFGYNRLSEITVSEDNTKYSSAGNCCLSKDKRVLFFGCKTSTIPNEVIQIGDCAFIGCLKLYNIHLPNRVKVIGDRAFAYCLDLKDINIPDGVTTIGKETFATSGVRSLDIPDSVQEISGEAFHSYDIEESSIVKVSSHDIPQILYFQCIVRNMSGGYIEMSWRTLNANDCTITISQGSNILSEFSVPIKGTRIIKISSVWPKLVSTVLTFTLKINDGQCLQKVQLKVNPSI